MGVKFITIDVEGVLRHKRRVKIWLLKVIESEKKELGEVIIAFCSDSYIVRENIRFLSHNYATDIITFDYCQEQIVSGDLLISLQTVKSNAKQWNVSFGQELDRVMVHGVLHLCGYGDKTESEQKIMRGKEDFYLKVLDEI